MAESSVNAPKQRAHWLNKRLALDVRDPVPFEDTTNFWRAVARPATIVMCVLAFGAFLYFARSLLLPVLCAFIVGMTFGPYIGHATKRGVPAWLIAVFVVVLLVAVANLAVIMLSNPISEMLRRTPELATAIKDKLSVLDRVLIAFYELQATFGGEQTREGAGLSLARVVEGFVTIVTPAAVQFVLGLVLFLGTLFFFILGRSTFRAYTVNWFSERAARLRALKILNDIEDNLSGYLVVVTAINLSLGLVTVAMTWALGLPFPLLWGALACVLNYLPYIGPGITCVLLFGAGLLTYPTLAGALLPPAIFLGITTIEGQFLTPAIIGRSVLLVQPLAIFLGIAFWAWLWGPLGAFLATPLLIVARAMLDHLYPRHKAELPE